MWGESSSDVCFFVVDKLRDSHDALLPPQRMLSQFYDVFLLFAVSCFFCSCSWISTRVLRRSNDIFKTRKSTIVKMKIVDLEHLHDLHKGTLGLSLLRS